MVTPSYLQPGDKIIIVSPAGKVTEEHVLPAAKWLEEQGYRVELGKNVFASHFQYAGTDYQRYKDMQKALDDKEAKAILCSRGGYGTVRIINKLDFSIFMQYPKWIIGFSDITILHSCLNNKRVATIHGVMPKYFWDKKGSPNDNLITLMDILTGKKVTYTLPGSEYNQSGKVTAELVGGNLSIISSMFGTCCELNTKNKILFIEEIDEFLYHADRMMHQLNMSGKLSKLAGLVIGNFTDMKDNESPFGKNIHEIISEAVSNFEYPVCFGFPGGHDEKNLALAFGKTWELDISKRKTILTLII
jgi:muramoyltetrapeptide carboxypeptidase